MKFKTFFLTAVSVALSAGCVYSHRPVVYRTAPTEVVAPASERPAVRVYQEAPPLSAHAVIVEPTTPGAAATTTPTSTDLNIADSIRQMFDADPSLASKATNAKIYVSDRTVTMEGTVPSRTDKNEIQKRILTIPSVAEVNNRLDIAVPGR